jgi:hypothetical protein
VPGDKVFISAKLNEEQGLDWKYFSFRTPTDPRRTALRQLVEILTRGRENPLIYAGIFICLVIPSWPNTLGSHLPLTSPPQIKQRAGNTHASIRYHKCLPESLKAQ